MKLQRLGPSNRRKAAIRQSTNPRHAGAVVEPDHEFGLEIQASALASDDPYQLGGAVARRHEIDQRRFPLGCLEFGLEHERAIAVAPADTRRRVGRCDLPSPVVRRPEQGGKAGGRVKSRPAQPVNRAVAGNEGGRLTVSDEGVIFDSCWHAWPECFPGIALASPGCLATYARWDRRQRVDGMLALRIVMTGLP